MGKKRKKANKEMKEVWKPVIGYEDWYSISNKGRVCRDMPRRFGRLGGLLKPTKDTSGYYQVKFYKNGISKTFGVHRLLATAFIGEKPEGMQVNHKDTKKSNNYISNLEYLTQSENAKHAYRNGCYSKKGDKL